MAVPEADEDHISASSYGSGERSDNTINKWKKRIVLSFQMISHHLMKNDQQPINYIITLGVERGSEETQRKPKEMIIKIQDI